MDLRIDRLVLDGFRWDARERERFRAEVEAELTRLLTERGLWSAEPATNRRPTAPVDLRGVTVADGAARVARQVYAQVCQQVGDRASTAVRP
ncbi:hypothetical protein [Nocardioides sp.]|uniref:hypothetical protein n=1 Tax=Nocardioides sp. TaxID=35761 RepID=UPI002D1FA077|nr:hypothetical protein [Nocardioides sp.]